MRKLSDFLHLEQPGSETVLQYLSLLLSRKRKTKYFSFISGTLLTTYTT